MMEYRIKAHPTKYAGVTFRSRLEATWAAYFDLCKIEWRYEPIDLDGWVPDFALAHGVHEILAEVKPCRHPGADESYAKALAHRDVAWVLLLGREPELAAAGLLLDHPSLHRSDGDPWWSFHNKISPSNTLTFWKRAAEKTRWRKP